MKKYQISLYFMFMMTFLINHIQILYILMVINDVLDQFLHHHHHHHLLNFIYVIILTYFYQITLLLYIYTSISYAINLSYGVNE